jgi:hypothetical protein
MEDESNIANALAWLVNFLLLTLAGLIGYKHRRQDKRIDDHDAGLEGVRAALTKLDGDFRDRSDKAVEKNADQVRRIHEKVEMIERNLGSKIDTNHAAVMKHLLSSGGQQ